MGHNQRLSESDFRFRCPSLGYATETYSSVQISGNGTDLRNTIAANYGSDIEVRIELVGTRGDSLGYDVG
jgi:hypothetical protein